MYAIFSSENHYLGLSILCCVVLYTHLKMIVYILIIIVLLLCIIHVLFNYNKKARMLKKLPGPPDTFILGNALEINLSAVELFNLGRKYANTWNGIYRFWAFPIAAVNIYNPQDIEIVISTMKHSEKSMVYSFLKPWLQDGLLLSKGAKWQHRRKVLTPAFHFNILREFHGILQNNSQKLVDALENQLGQAVDIVPILSEFTLNSICETAMGTQLCSEANETAKQYKNAIYDIGKIFYKRFITPAYYFDFLFNLSPLGKKQNKYIHIIKKFTGKVIKDRREYMDKNGIQAIDCSENDNDDFLNKKRRKIAMLDLLLLAEKDGMIDGAGIEEEVETFMFEGHDTTASGLTFCLMLLANNKMIQDKIVEELNEIFGDSERPASLDDLSKMRYLECCIKESLRLYPPVHLISRNLNESIQLSNYVIPAGSLCHIHVYDLHRRKDLFKKPLVFDPDRFLPENCIGRHPYAYIPFSAGPRNCIGQRFAMMEMKTSISALLREYELLPVTRPEDLRLESDVVLRNADPVCVQFVKRNNNNK